MKTLAHGYVIRSPQRKHLSTHGSGPVNCNHKCISIMQGHARTTCMYLGATNGYSKWMDVHIMHTTTIAKLREIFATHALPETLVTDNGPKFTKPQMDKQSELLKTRTNG